MEETGLTGAAHALAEDTDRVLEAWIDRYERSWLRLPGAVDRPSMRPLFEPVVAALRDAAGAEPIRPGAQELRELEKDLSFLGASFAAGGASSFDAAAAAVALRDVVAELARTDGERGRTSTLFDWFTAIVLEGFAHGRSAAITERHREHLEERTPVVMVAPDVPAAFPIGDSDVHGLRGAFARLALMVARVGARVVLVDASGLVAPTSPGVLAAVREYCAHRKIAGEVALVTAGLSDDQQRQWGFAARGCGVEYDARDSFREALERALHWSDYAFVRGGER